MVQKRHSDVCRIETTIKHDINVSITPLFYKGRHMKEAALGLGSREFGRPDPL
jgi:hypothetical protein